MLTCEPRQWNNAVGFLQLTAVLRSPWSWSYEMAEGARSVDTSRGNTSRGQHAMRLKYINDRTAAIALGHAHRTRRRNMHRPPIPPKHRHPQKVR